MSELDIHIRSGGGRMWIPRRRGALLGVSLLLLGLWGALAPFVGPLIDFSYPPNTPWVWTAARWWLEVLPGVVTIVGAVMLTVSNNRATAVLGAWLSLVGGAWFLLGRIIVRPLDVRGVGSPVASTDTKALWVELAFFNGLGAVIVALAAFGMGRVSVRSLKDIRFGGATIAMTDPRTASEHGAAPANQSDQRPVPGGADAGRAGTRRQRLAELFRRRRTRADHDERA